MQLLADTLSPTTTWLLGIAGWLVSVTVAYWLGRYRAKAARRAMAADGFRKAVNQAVKIFPGPREQWRMRVTSAQFHKFASDIAEAVANFAPFLPRKKRRDFEQLCEELRVQCTSQWNSSLRKILLAASIDNGAAEEGAAKGLLFARVEKLKSFAPER